MYVATSLPGALIAIGGLSVVLLTVVLLCSLLNLLARRRVLNGWLWGAIFVGFLVAYHLLVVFSQPPPEISDPQANDPAETFFFAAGLVTMLAVAVWRAIVWRRRAVR